LFNRFPFDHRHDGLQIVIPCTIHDSAHFAPPGN
jgi:hypothetical protein